MDDVAIKVEGLGKKYKIGRKKTDHLRDSLAHFFKKKSYENHQINEFWALKNIDFEVKKGEAVGIIGRNGAGKSTLLKILSRITKPTKGRFEINGRVSSLLEVGTGFHMELSGKENIFLNGTILGMKRREIKEKFDEIVAFSGVENFIDTPVKHYSSGMKVRLAFSVAAHLEPEILIIDEVLAVGDAEFQKKCLGKMEDVAGEGRTVLFVSHNMKAVQNLCKTGILINAGQASKKSPVDEVIKNYLSIGKDDLSNIASYSNSVNYRDEIHTFRRISLVNKNRSLHSNHINKNHTVFVEVEIDLHELDNSLNIGYGLYTEGGDLLYWSFFKDSSEENWPEINLGINIFQSEIPMQLLNEGRYFIEYIAALHHKKWLVEPSKDNPRISFEALPGNYSSPLLGITKRRGVLMPIFEWYNVK